MKLTFCLKKLIISQTVTYLHIVYSKGHIVSKVAFNLLLLARCSSLYCIPSYCGLHSVLISDAEEYMFVEIINKRQLAWVNAKSSCFIHGRAKACLVQFQDCKDEPMNFGTLQECRQWGGGGRGKLPPDDSRRLCLETF